MQLEHFETALGNILGEDDGNHDQKDEIPEDIRNKFKLPKNMGTYQINFN